MNNNKLYYEEVDETEDVMNIDDYIQDEPDDEDSNGSDETGVQKSSEAATQEDEYKVSSISSNFLRIETSIKLESSKTVIKFEYRKDFYKGVVMQKFGSKKDEYIFLVVPCDKNGRVKSGEKKVLKKFYIPDVNLI